ncbi:MAG: hypothetical protein ABFR31_10865 [Thermodesulfobacteriota bacterium]
MKRHWTDKGVRRMHTIPDNKNILLVAEKYNNLFAIEKLLYPGEIECVVDEVSSCDQAVEFLKHNTYDVAVLDITEFKSDELFKRINKHQVPSFMIITQPLTQNILRQLFKKSKIN